MLLIPLILLRAISNPDVFNYRWPLIDLNVNLAPRHGPLQRPLRSAHWERLFRNILGIACVTDPALDKPIRYSVDFLQQFYHDGRVHSENDPART